MQPRSARAKLPVGYTTGNKRALDTLGDKHRLAAAAKERLAGGESRQEALVSNAAACWGLMKHDGRRRSSLASLVPARAR